MAVARCIGRECQPPVACRNHVHIRSLRMRGRALKYKAFKACSSRPMRRAYLLPWALPSVAQHGKAFTRHKRTKRRHKIRAVRVRRMR
eukprot:352861-Chlamydomonas_euryale.AAC.16